MQENKQDVTKVVSLVKMAINVPLVSIHLENDDTTGELLLLVP